METSKPCPKCGNEMLFKTATTGMPDRYVCTNCGHDEPIRSSITSESKRTRRTLVD